jgi:hypothetical protein
MGSRPRVAPVLQDTERLVHQVFEPQLRSLGLTVGQIEKQDLAELEVSLDRLNEAIANADSFGKIRLEFTSDSNVLIKSGSTAAVIELGILPVLLERKAVVLDRIRGGKAPFSVASESASTQEKSAILRIDIDGSWPVDDITKLLTKLEQAYLAAAALESLTEPSRMGLSASATTSHEYTADELLRAVVAFRLGGGLRIQSIYYNSPGFIAVIGALNPLKTVKDGITENRDINRKREETRLATDVELQKLSIEHQQAIEQERRQSEEMLLAHQRKVAKLQIEAQETRIQAFLSVMDRLPPAQRTAAAADLFQLMLQNVEGIANDSRVGEITMLESKEPAVKQSTTNESSSN